MKNLSEYFVGDENIRQASALKPFTRHLHDIESPALNDVEESEFVVPAFGDDAKKTVKLTSKEAYVEAGTQTQALAACITNADIVVKGLIKNTNKAKQPAQYKDLYDIWDKNRQVSKALDVIVDKHGGWWNFFDWAGVWGGGTVSSGNTLLQMVTNLQKDQAVIVGRLRGYGQNVPGCGKLVIKQPSSVLQEIANATKDAVGKGVDFTKFLIYAALVGGGIYAVSTVGVAYLNQKEKKGAK